VPDARGLSHLQRPAEAADIKGDMGGVIRFPTERRADLPASGRTDGRSAAEAAPAPEPLADGQPFAFLTAEIRRIPRTDSRIDGEIAGRILSRCVLSSLEILAKERVPVDLAGTVLRPVVEARFPGPDGPTRAAQSGLAIRHAVTGVQREAEHEFFVFGAIASGSVSRSDGGVTLTAGAPEQVAARLREHAAPGEFLMSEDAWQTCADSVRVAGTPIEVTMPGAEPVAAYPLTDPT
jgi:class 3 adenylate cyclase